MWSKVFDQRLRSWLELRSRSKLLPMKSALMEINSWWADSPWCPYYLHWDDQHNWPDPWQLLDDNIFCNLARGLGIMYTVVLLNRSDMKNCLLFEHNGDNLVQVGQEKYILNSSEQIIVNNNLEICKSKRNITGQQIKQKFKLE